jgi:hypothetical protein
MLLLCRFEARDLRLESRFEPILCMRASRAARASAMARSLAGSGWDGAEEDAVGEAVDIVAVVVNVSGKSDVSDGKQISDPFKGVEAKQHVAFQICCVNCTEDGSFR